MIILSFFRFYFFLSRDKREKFVVLRYMYTCKGATMFMRESGVALDAIAVMIPFRLFPPPFRTRRGGTIEGIEHDPQFTSISPVSNIFFLAVGFGRIVLQFVP